MDQPAAAGTAAPPRAAERHVPTSVTLGRLVRDAPAGHVTLAWLLGHLRRRSFGIVLLLLGTGLLVSLPLGNVPIGLTIVLLALALAVALGLFAAGAAALWGTIATAAWLSR